MPDLLQLPFNRFSCFHFQPLPPTPTSAPQLGDFVVEGEVSCHPLSESLHPGWLVLHPTAWPSGTLPCGQPHAHLCFLFASSLCPAPRWPIPPHLPSCLPGHSSGPPHLHEAQLPGIHSTCSLQNLVRWKSKD